MRQQATNREFEQRFLDGFERSRIRQEVQKSRKTGFSSLKKRYATMILGASLAVGGLGIPMTATRSLDTLEQASSSHKSGLMNQITADLLAAREIGRQVTGGVTAAAGTIATPLTESAVDRSFRAVTEQARKEFFKTEIPFGAIIYEEARKNDLDPAFVAAVVKTESRFIPTARSGANAQGLMQLVPRTGKWMGAKNLMNPTENVRAGTKYLKYLNGRFDGNQTMVIAAYNAGEGNVKKFGGIPPFKETQNYVNRVRDSHKQFSDQMAGKMSQTLEATAGIAMTR